MAGKTNNWEKLSKNDKKKTVIKCVFLYLFILAGVIFFVGYFYKMSFGRLQNVDMSALEYGLSFFIIDVILSALIFILIIAVMAKNSLFNTVKDVDYRNIKFMEDTTAGDARWMNRQEMEENYTIGDIDDLDVPIYGQISNDGSEVIGYKKRATGASMNQNVLVMAAMGMGKSYGPVRTNLLQAVKRGESFVVTDPSGELYSSLAGYCMDMGLAVHIIDLDKPEYSEFWNVLEETINPETERLDGGRLNDFAAIYMQNSGGSEHQDFWYTSALNLIKTVIGYTAWLHENEILNNFMLLYKIVAGVSGDDAVTNRMKTTVCSFPWVKDQIRRVARINGYDMDELEKLLYEIQYVLPENQYNMSVVFDKLLRFTEVEAQIKSDIDSGLIPEMHPAKIAYMMYQTNDTETVRKSALQGAQLRFALFSDENAKEFLSHDGIHISDITKEQTAFFVILSDKTQTLKPIASLFFTFLFKDTQDAWDVAAQAANAQGVPNPRRQLTVMLDEFYSIGIIGGSPDAFGTTMSNSRKREIHIWIVVQGYSQLAALYGPEIGNIIQGGCSTLLYLGGNDPDTVDFISSFVAGDASVQMESHQENSGLLSNGVASNTANVSVATRKLLTTSEARRWHNHVLIASQGQYIVRANSFPWVQHPAYEECEFHPVSIYEEIPPISKRLDDMAMNTEVLTDDAKTYVRNKANALCGYARASYYSSMESTADIDDDIETSQPETKETAKPQNDAGSDSIGRPSMSNKKKGKQGGNKQGGNKSSQSKYTNMNNKGTTYKYNGGINGNKQNKDSF